MNIQKLISQIRQARKRRKIFLFHDKPRSGIDVPDSDWIDVISLISSLFKYFKSQHCQIEISWWGEIFITLFGFDTPFEVSINQRPSVGKMEKIIKEIDVSNGQVPITIDSYCLLSLTVRPIRRLTKWHVFQVEMDEVEPDLLGKKVLEHAHQKISSYRCKDNKLNELKTITEYDLIAVMRLGGALYGKNSMFSNICVELKNRMFVSGMSFTDGILVIDGGLFNRVVTYHLGKKEIAFILKYLPDGELYTNQNEADFD